MVNFSHGTRIGLFKTDLRLHPVTVVVGCHVPCVTGKLAAAHQSLISRLLFLNSNPHFLTPTCFVPNAMEG